MKIVRGNEFVEFMQAKLGSGLLSARVETRTAGVLKSENDTVWLDVEREALVPAVRAMKELDYPLYSVASTYDHGDYVTVMHHLALYVTQKNQGLYINLQAKAPKDDLVLPTISGELPGAVTSEQEKREMMGVQFAGLPPMDNIFLPRDFPADIYPWRRDETGMDANKDKVMRGEGK